MFRSAVWRLTAWYLFIIAIICLVFSTFVYFSSPREVRSGLREGGEGPAFFGPPPGYLNDATVNQLREQAAENIRHRMLVDLIEFDLLLLVAGGGASYLLAQRTLRPIEAALLAQSRFTADASHELRTPLTAMRAEIEVALRDGKLTKAEAVKLLKSNLEEVAKLEGLSLGLLKLAQRDGSEPPDEKVSLAKVIREAASRQAKSAKARDIAVEVEVGEFVVIGDEAALTDLFSILLDNAIKYSHRHGVVRVKAVESSGWVRVSVRDEGIGIKALDLPHIFSRFYRADSSRSKAVSGYGLGLSIAQKITASHGGGIEVESTPDQGSTFTVSLRQAKKS